MLVVPDRHGTGTNALLLQPPDVMAPSFGEGSHARHLGNARGAGIAAETVELAVAGARHRHTRGSGRRRGGARAQPRWRRAHPRACCGSCCAAAAKWRRSAPPRSRACRRSGRGDDPARLIAAALGRPAACPPSDVLVVAHKLISKAEGRTRRLSEVDAGPSARRARRSGSARTRGSSQVVLDESREVRRAEHGVLISRHPSRVRVRQRRRRRLQHARRRHRDPAAGRPRRLRPAAARRRWRR